MSFEEIVQLMQSQFGEEIIMEQGLNDSPQSITVDAGAIFDLCLFLKEDDRLYFDQLSCLTGVDYGMKANTMGVVYNLYSIPFNHHLMIKVVLPRNEEGADGPEIASVESLWKTADWHEREAFDLFGIRFSNHPDLRRILLPADWQGHPMRKDYEVQEYYHGIKVKY
ncbi:NADH-quinone oxidoreductase subunit C [Persicobacter psychrovividus]|uniref:NADH-quinone oxidoreductase subunit C n=1 Tax=Persicobacter psychrovividus TaxID=387638 RepID=A0ABM7VHC3_9BACT|nr:NADH-quinone oxidoreductase subunit C [Persicobacter psychrovividus]